ncbi:hypothetical protein FQN54_005229 [Arachnomyces sp. PD_36]|nr:hypothetical protein FQN54_005229 [Arachnomyces sp. PD_36]
MSFNIGIGDFVALLDLANRVRKRVVNAPAQYQGIVQDLKVLSNVLRDIDDFDPHETLDERQKKNLNLISQSCHRALKDLDRKLTGYQELGASLKSTSLKKIPRWGWERIHWNQSEINELRNQISQNVDALNLLLTGISSNAALQTLDFVKSTKEAVDALVRHQDQGEILEILEWLCPINVLSKQAGLLSDCQEGTGRWFLQTESYRQWVNSPTPDHHTLFCPGIPGAGKTLLTSTVVNELHCSFQHDSSVGLAFFYCEFRERVALNTILSCLLGQLARKLPILPDPVKDLYDERLETARPQTAGSFLNVLDAVVSRFVKVFIVIDALDECLPTGGTCATLLESIFTLQANHHVRFLATSRDYPEISARFDDSPCLRIRAHEDDIEKFLRSQINQVGVLPYFVQRKPELQKDIIADITKAVDGMFLLARLHFDSLKGCLSPAQIRKKLKTLSNGLDAAYGDAIERIESQLPEKSKIAKQVLAWIVCATRPLTPRELQHALAVEIDETALDDENIPEINDLVEVCAGLVTVDEQSDAVRLAHYTTQEYLEQNQATIFPNAHVLLGSVCMTYLNFDAFRSGFAPSRKELNIRLKNHPLYSYSALNWDVHLRTQEGHSDLVLELLRDEGKVTSCAQILLEEREPVFVSRSIVEDIKGLHLAVYLELYDAAQILLAEGPPVDIRDSTHRTLLSWMAEVGSLNAVIFLLNEGADPNAVDINGQTALSYAALKGHEEIFRTLRERGAQLESKDKQGRTPLFYAVWGGHEKVVKLLLSEPIDADCQDSHGQTPLLHAVQRLSGMRKTVTIMEQLLSAGVNLNQKDKTGQGPLLYAVQRESIILVELLLKAGADKECRNDKGETALAMAVERGYEDIVELLLEWGASANCKGRDGQTPLSASARRGNQSMVKLLLGGGVDPNHKDDLFGKSVLSYAAWSGHVSIVNILLERGANPNCKDQQGRTPLSWAAEYGHLAVVSSLLDCGIDANFEEDLCRQTPLDYAVSNGHQAVVNLLSSREYLTKGPDHKGIEEDRERWSKPKCFMIID